MQFCTCKSAILLSSSDDTPMLESLSSVSKRQHICLNLFLSYPLGQCSTEDEAADPIV